MPLVDLANSVWEKDSFVDDRGLKMKISDFVMSLQRRQRITFGGQEDQV